MEHVQVVVVGGGQSGLSAAAAVRAAGGEPVLLEAGRRPVGSWPRYYDSLTLFSPARYSALAGRLDGDPDRYPTRDEVVDHVARYAAGLDVEIRTGTRVRSVTAVGRRFLVRTECDELTATHVVAASGSFGRPLMPSFPGRAEFRGEVRHVAQYREPTPWRGRRVVVVGAGNSAVQVAHELAAVADVTLTSRRPVHFAPQRILGRDAHWWAARGVDRIPSSVSAPFLRRPRVMDDGTYRSALAEGVPRWRPLFDRFDPGGVVWPDGSRTDVDAVLLATGYLPDVGYLEGAGALDAAGLPRHRGGLSTVVPGLGFVGLEMQRSFASNTLRGVARDARYVVRHLLAQDAENGSLAWSTARPRAGRPSSA